MNDADVLAYVQAAARVLELPLDDSRAHAVALQLGRTLQLARQLEAFPMPLEEEPCALFCPAPFPPLFPPLFAPPLPEAAQAAP